MFWYFSGLIAARRMRLALGVEARQPAVSVAPLARGV
jgi:hypothetical protein